MTNDLQIDQATLIRLTREAGVIGQGGAGFPAHVKYDTRVETVIANGCECEPLLYSDRYLMESRPREIIRGLRVLKSAVGAKRGVIAIKRKYEEVDRIFTAALTETDLEIARLDNFYPAGDEHVLVHEITGRTITPLGLPKEVGALVANVGTLASLSQALDGRPVTHKIVTVTGEVIEPGLLRAPVGTSVTACVEKCGGAAIPDPIYILGGPMMGRFLDRPADIEQAVIDKTSGGIIVLPRGHYLHECASLTLRPMQRRAAAACIQCRYCTDLCPRFLIGHDFETHRVMRAFAQGLETGQARRAVLCSECGVCELYICPMRLSPRRVNAWLKNRFKEQGLAYRGPREVFPERSALREYRKIPVSRLAIKTGLADYLDIHPQYQGDLTPESVRIPLGRHIGATAVAQVKRGDKVKPGDLIGEIPAGALGARVHASIEGVVTETGTSITIERT